MGTFEKSRRSRRGPRRDVALDWRLEWAFLVAFVASPFLTVTPTAARSDSIPLDTILDVKIIEESPITLSPDQTWVAYVVRDALPKQSPKYRNFARQYECSGLYPDSFSTEIKISNVLTGETVTVGSEGNNWMPAWSVDGRHLAFLSDRDGSGETKLWIWDQATGKLRKLSDVGIRANQISWTPDGESIVTTIRNGDIRSDSDIECRSDLDTTSGSRRVAEASSVVVYEWNPNGKDGAQRPRGSLWNLETKIRDLAEFDVETGRMKRLTHGARISVFRLSANGAEIGFTSATRFEEPGSQQILFDLRVVARATDEQWVAAAGIRLGFSGLGFAWSPDGERLVFQTSGVSERIGDCYSVRTNGKDLRNLTSLPPQQNSSPELPPLWDEARAEIYFIRDQAMWRASTNAGGASEIVRIPGRQILEMVGQESDPLEPRRVGGSMVLLTEDSKEKQSGFYKVDLATLQSTLVQEKSEQYDGASRASLLRSSPERDFVIYLAQDAANPLDLWITDLNSKTSRRLTHANPELDKYQMGAVKLVRWRGLDGQELSGALLLPSHYEAQKRYPLLVWVYGGSLGSNDRNVFGFTGLGGPYNMQLFATRGYAVFAPDAPQQIGSPMLDLAKTVLPGINKVIEMGVADPDRVGIMGHSYGGYSVWSLVVQTARFRAALVSDGFGDLITAYGELGRDGSAFQTSMAERGQGLMGGTPWEFRDRYIENSPIFYLERVKTPVLLVHGGDDNVVAPYLADQMFVSLRRLGAEVVYAKYVGEDHYPVMWSRANQRDLGNRMLAWFDKFLGDN
jgi:dipeptidyl aminopeptidase/acylaminoacyl peptidase